MTLRLNNGANCFTNDPMDDLMDRLIEKTKSAKHCLSFDEASKDPEMYQPNSYAYYFGSFTEAARTAWNMVKSGQSVTRKKPIQPTTLTALTDTAKKRGRKPRHTFEEIAALLLEFYQQNGRLPTQTEVACEPDWPCWPTMVKHLGPRSGWEERLSLLSKKVPLVVTKTEEDGVKVETSHHTENDTSIITVKVIIPNREKPFLITLTMQ